MSKRKYEKFPTPLLGWKAWYGDGSVYTSKEFTWVEIPVMNFQYLKKFYDQNTDTYAGKDLFCISDDPAEILRLIKLDPGNIKIGKKIENWSEFQDKIELEKDVILEMV